MLTSQKDEVFIILRDIGLDPRDFVWERVMPDPFESDMDDPYADLLRHRPTSYYYRFATRRSGAEFSPANESEVSYSKAGSWSEQAKDVATWAKYLKREINTPDFWSALEAVGANTSLAVGQEENTLFSAEEQTRLRHELAAIGDYVRSTHELSKENRDRLSAVLDYVAEASSRIGRVDWRTLFIGSMMSLILEGVVSSERAQAFFQFSMRAIQAALENLPPLP